MIIRTTYFVVTSFYFYSIKMILSMETCKKERHILESIRLVTDKAKKSNLSLKFFNENGKELQKLSVYFDTTPVQSLLISSILAYNFNRGPAGVDDLSDFFDCNPLLLLEYKTDLDHLLKQGMLKKVVNRRSRNAFGLANLSFFVPDNISDAILANKPIPKQDPAKAKDVLDLLESVYSMGWNSEDESNSTEELIDKTKELLKEYQEFSLVKKLNQLKLSGTDMILMLYMYWKFVNGEKDVNLEGAINGIHTNTRKRFEYSKSFLVNVHPLIGQGLVEIRKNRFVEDSFIKLTSKSIHLLLSDDLNLLLTSEKRDNTIVPQDISSKRLIYSPNEAERLDQLKQSLSEINLTAIQERMKQRGLPTGFTVLFYGSPGTGKTESVYQIARETGREIMLVDISKSKSSWFGESEKLIKKVFAEYNEFVKESKLCPILLFNEADGIFSKRKDVGSSNVAQTENAIQNIILQELETFAGILIATTNLVSNFDKAFERRFLYKIKFSKPDTGVRAQIWKLKLPDISEGDALFLAGHFDLSGGQIDNIARKCEIIRILDNRDIMIEEIISFCKEETFESQSINKIGFRKEEHQI